MAVQSIPVPGEIAIKVCIGEVCVQWSRLEMALIGLICQIEPMEVAKAYIIFGGLDIQPRVNMALNLAHHNKVPASVTKRIRALRKQLQGGLTDRRNQVVHGAHRDMEGAEITLTMVRLKGDKRDTRLSAVDIAALAAEIHELGSEVWSISNELLNWSVGKHVEIYLGNDFSSS